MYKRKKKNSKCNKRVRQLGGDARERNNIPEVILPVRVATVEERFQTRLVLIVFQTVQLGKREPAIVVAVQMSEHPPDLALAADREVTWKQCTGMKYEFR